MPSSPFLAEENSGDYSGSSKPENHDALSDAISLVSVTNVGMTPKYTHLEITDSLTVEVGMRNHL
jgi:hypothetical protein